MSVRWLFIMSTSFSDDDGRYVEQNSFGNLLVDDLMRKIEGVLKSLIFDREKALRVGRHSSIRIAIAIINSVKALVSYRFHLLRLSNILPSWWSLVHLLQHFKMDLLGWYTSHTELHHITHQITQHWNKMPPPSWTSTSSRPHVPANTTLSKIKPKLSSCILHMQESWLKANVMLKEIETYEWRSAAQRGPHRSNSVLASHTNETSAIINLDTKLRKRWDFYCWQSLHGLSFTTSSRRHSWTE